MTKNRIKIILAVLISFLVVKTATPQVFMANTPKINPEFIIGVKNSPKTMMASISNLFKKKTTTDTTDIFANVQSVTAPSNAVFKSVAKGVSAAEDTTTGKKYLKVEAGTKYKITGTVTINGKEYPKIEFVE